MSESMETQKLKIKSSMWSEKIILSISTTAAICKEDS